MYSTEGAIKKHWTCYQTFKLPWNSWLPRTSTHRMGKSKPGEDPGWVCEGGDRWEEAFWNRIHRRTSFSDPEATANNACMPQGTPQEWALSGKARHFIPLSTFSRSLPRPAYCHTGHLSYFLVLLRQSALAAMVLFLCTHSSVPRLTLWVCVPIKSHLCHETRTLLTKENLTTKSAQYKIKPQISSTAEIRI